MSKKNLKEIVYDSVLNSIYSSEYRANEIITETSLIQKYGYSKSPIREALTALCHEGVLKNIPRWLPSDRTHLRGRTKNVRISNGT